MAELVIQSGKHQGRRLRFSEPAVVIGREESCQIRLTSADVSKQHCRLRNTERGLSVEDLGSSNGTFVNDVRIESETPLQSGDRLRVGSLVFEVPTAAKPAVAASPARGKKSKPLSEDDIASWLTVETDHGEGASSADTTIIETTPAAKPARANGPPASTASVAAAAADTGSPAVAGREDRKRFRTVAEEAADIIRRWWEMQREEQHQP